MLCFYDVLFDKLFFKTKRKEDGAMKVISDDISLKNSLKRAFGKECPDVIFIDVVGADNKYDVALEEARNGKPVIVLDFKSPADIVDDLRIRKLMCKKNVGYIQIPFTLDRVKYLYSVLQRGKRIEEDPFAQELQKRYEKFNSRSDRIIATAFVATFGSSRALNDILQPPSQRYKCE